MNLRTRELMEMLKKHQNIVEFVEYNSEEFSKMTMCEALLWLSSKYNVKKADVIRRSGVNQIYGYQIFAGSKKPSRDKLIALMFGLSASVEDGNILLGSAGLCALHPRDKRDAVIIFALHNSLAIDEIDDLLFELNLETISKG